MRGTRVAYSLTMLRLQHRYTSRDTGASFVRSELRAPGFVALRTRVSSAVYADDFASYSAPISPWSHLVLPLEGELLVGAPGEERSARPGVLTIMPLSSRTVIRALGPSTDVVFLAWNDRTAVGPALRCLDQVEVKGAPQQALAALGPALTHGDERGLGDALEQGRAALDALGISLDPERVAEVLRNVPAADDVFARALSRVIFPLSGRPRMVDLAATLGVGERQASRLAAQYFARHHATVSSFGEYVRGMRLGLAVLLMSHPRARTETVSHELGFAAPTGFCHALHFAGLPSPQRVREDALRHWRRAG
jgi:AraC-like DNA-binding protein